MINLGLQRISALLNPLFTTYPNTLPWKAIHIAGTNGKGSIASLISTFLSDSGYSVGRFTSPHLIDRWDCITLNQRVVERERFLAAEAKVRQRSESDNVGASEFELLTATAFELFTDEKVDVAVVECGLGGRLDATNVLRQGDVLVSVLAKVGLDHTEFLGDTIEKVAREKTGIFKAGVPVVVDGSNAPEVLDVLRERMAALGSSEGGPFVLDEQQSSVLLSKSVARLGLAKHQEQNLRTAWTAYCLAEQRMADLKSQDEAEPGINSMHNVDRTEKKISELIRLAQTSLRGRLEWLTIPAHFLPSGLDDRQTQAKFLLDGAHNPQSAHALASYVDTNVRGTSGQVTWVLAVKNGKEVRKILSILLRPEDNVVTCSFGPVDGMPWVKSMDAVALAEIVTESSPAAGIVEAAESGSVKAAITKAVKIAGQGPICIAGSLYLVGDVLRMMRDAEEAAKEGP
ncbi:folylpolyglutamate synthase [Exophiala xenobiotica]|nr:folylpolyglutamate synthase [Exophiala xenobiotica]